MKARLLATTALAIGLALPTAVAAQQSNTTKQGTQVQGAQQDTTRTSAGSTTGQGSGQMQEAQLQEAMSKLRSARQDLEQASQGGDQQAVERARQDAQDAIRQIDMALQSAETQGSGEQQDAVRKAQQSVDQVRQDLQQKNTPPQKLAGSLDDLDSAVADLVGQRDQTQAAADVQVKQPPADVTVKQPAPQVTVQQPEPKVTVTQPEPKVTVEQPEPKVTVDTQKPNVNVTSQEPDVQVKEGGQAEVTVKEGDSSTSTGQAATSSREQTAAMTWREDQLVGQTLYGANDEEVGEIDEVVMGTGGEIQSVLIDIGGFLGIGGKQVAIPVEQIEMQGDRLVSASLTRQQAESMPEYQQ